MTTVLGELLRMAPDMENALNVHPIDAASSDSDSDKDSNTAIITRAPGSGGSGKSGGNGHERHCIVRLRFDKSCNAAAEWLAADGHDGHVGEGDTEMLNAGHDGDDEAADEHGGGADSGEDVGEESDEDMEQE